MSELVNNYWPMILVAVAIGLIVGLVVFRRPRQRVTLSKAETPVRPHMAAAVTDAEPRNVDGPEGNGIADEMAAAASDVVGMGLGAPVHDHLPGHDADDLQRMKGVGPKLAAILRAKGFARYRDIAALTPEEAAALDADLGSFKGRLARDRVVEQAGFLAAGDQAGYEAAFGKL